MERVFLSYTYRPHPDYAADTDALQRTARRVIEAMDLRPIDGVDLAGRGLDDAIQARIAESDALIALYTPQRRDDGTIEDPQFVITEFQHAKALNKPRFRVIHQALNARGLGAGEEHQVFDAGTAVDVTIKLMSTIALWKRELGRAVQVRVDPEELIRRFKNGDDSCHYELMVNFKTRAAVETQLWTEPGGAFVHVPNLVDGAKVRVRMRIGGERWESSFAVPHMAGISLEKA